MRNARNNLRVSCVWVISTILITLCLYSQATAFSSMKSQDNPQKVMDSAISGHESTGTMVVAKVNETEILMSQLMDKIRKLTMGKQQGQELTPAMAEQIRKKALQMLITEELAYQHAKSLNITIDQADVSKKIAELKKSMQSEEHFQDYLKLKNINSEEELKIELEKFLAVQTAINQEVDQKIEVSEEDIQKAYENNIEKFTEHERIDITDVIFFLAPEAEESIQKARELRLRIINDYESNPSLLPADSFFAVRENITLNERIHEKLYAAAKETPKDALSDVLNIDGTLHIIKLTGYKPEKVKTLEEVKPELRGQLRSALRKMKLDEWKVNLFTDAKIEIIDFEVQ